MPTSADDSADHEDAREGLAETQEARKEARAEDAQGATDRQTRRRQACQPVARRLIEGQVETLSRDSLYKGEAGGCTALYDLLGAGSALAIPRPAHARGFTHCHSTDVGASGAIVFPRLVIEARIRRPLEVERRQ